MIAAMPKPETYNESMLLKFEFATQVIMSIRTMRQEKNISNKESIDLLIRKNNDDKPDLTFDDLVVKLCNLGKIEYIDNKPEGAFNFIIKTTEFYVPVKDNIDISSEIARLEQDLEYQQGFLNSVLKKLGNERFVNNAPVHVIESERKNRLTLRQGSR
jgi:valyl-tRNA synthetase